MKGIVKMLRLNQLLFVFSTDFLWLFLSHCTDAGVAGPCIQLLFALPCDHVDGMTVELPPRTCAQKGISVELVGNVDVVNGKPSATVCIKSGKSPNLSRISYRILPSSSSLSLAAAAISIISVATKLLSRQTTSFVAEKSMLVATKLCLWRQNVCGGSRQWYFFF